MKKIDFNKRIAFLTNTVASMEKKLATNQITEDARAEVEGRIEQLRGLISELESLRDAAAEGEDDKSEQLLTQMKEVLARVNAVEDSIKNDLNKGGAKKITDSKDYQKKFMEMVKNSTSSKDFKANLKKLAVENGITITDGDISELLPAAVLNEVNDVFINHRHRLLEVVDWTGLPVFKSMFETGDDLGHTWPSVMLGQEASAVPKTEQELEFLPITIRPQYVYKTIGLDKEVVRSSEADGSVFLRYIIRELLDRLLCTIEMYILTGNQENFIPPTPTALAQGSDPITSLHSLNYLPYNGGLVAICTPSFYISVRQQVLTNIGYAINDDFIAKDIFGVDEVIMTPPTFQVTGDQVGLFFLNPRAYKMVGDRRPDQYEDFNLSWNRMEYLMEMWIGGGCITPEFISIESGEGD